MEDEKKEKSREEINCINSSEWFSSSIYKSLFSSKFEKNKKWITEPIVKYLDSNYNKYNENNLENLIKKQPDKHKYSSTVTEALNIFNKFRKWQNLKEWKLSSSETFKTNDKYNTNITYNCYWNKIANSNICATKGEIILPYSTPIICGVLLNSKHEQKYQEYLDTIEDIQYLTQYADIMYVKTFMPSFISDRDQLAVGFIYVLPNAEIIIGCRSIEDKFIDDKYKLNKNNKYVRAFCELDLYHLHPWYEKNSNYTKITYYNHGDFNGSIPNWFSNLIVTDIPKILLKLKKYIDGNIKLLSQPGQLYIPLNMLQYIGIFPDEKLYKIKKSQDGADQDDNVNIDQLVQFAIEAYFDNDDNI